MWVKTAKALSSSYTANRNSSSPVTSAVGTKARIAETSADNRRALRLISAKAKRLPTGPSPRATLGRCSRVRTASARISSLRPSATFETTFRNEDSDCRHSARVRPMGGRASESSVGSSLAPDKPHCLLFSSGCHPRSTGYAATTAHGRVERAFLDRLGQGLRLVALLRTL